MTFVSNRRVVATIVAASCIAVPASASAGSLPPTYKSDAAQSSGSARIWTGARFSYPQPSSAKIGDTPAEFAQPVAAAPKGDTPVDHPGASRAVEYEPSTTIEVVRPERTIVRDVNEALPLVLSGSALMLVLVGLGFTLVRTGTVPRPGRSD
jgi:hypothetical protein